MVSLKDNTSFITTERYRITVMELTFMAKYVKLTWVFPDLNTTEMDLFLSFLIKLQKMHVCQIYIMYSFSKTHKQDSRWK